MELLTDTDNRGDALADATDKQQRQYMIACNVGSCVDALCKEYGFCLGRDDTASKDNN